MLKFLVLILSLNTVFAGFHFVRSTTESATEDVWKKIESLQAQIQVIQQRLEHCSLNPTTTNKENPKNCKEVQDYGHQSSGIYFIQPSFAFKPFPVLCNMETDCGGWTYLLNRFDGSQEFYLDWKSYKEGFGNLSGEFWLGLEKIHFLTGYEYNELLIELVFFDNTRVSAQYNTFTIGNENEGYILRVVEGYSGDAGDWLTRHVGMKFTTKDRDQDVWSDGNCADWSYGGWWYDKCKGGHLTGKYLKNNAKAKGDYKEIYWGNRNDVKQARMMVRPKRYCSIVPKK